MLSFSATESPSPEVAPSPQEVAPKPRKPWLIVTVVVIVVLIVAGVFAYWWLSRPSASRAAWLFDGAYAKYYGETTVLTMSMNMTLRLEVVDYNNTHAKLLMYMKMESDMMQPVEWQNTTWTDLRTASYEVEGYDLTETREDDVYFDGLGTKHCMIYEYSSPDMTMTYYVDKEIDWPLQMNFTVSEGSLDMHFDLTLTDTNIPGLQK